MRKERVLYIDDQVIATHGAWNGVHAESALSADIWFGMDLWAFIYA